MTLLTTINEDVKTAMKARDKEKLSVLRMLKSALQNEQIKKGTELNEEEELSVLSREMKQRRDSLTEFKNADRQDLVEKLENEIVIVEGYLPKQLTEEELQSIVQEVIASVNATSTSDFGKVMGAIMPKVKGKADGNAVNRIVKEQLS
ncbi:GatB/YqeY domain-containing protein [Desemzia incerta]|uniref:GatB/YqeY domain-containing protein n=1 Tax=Desemzia TaxID=82800 RepID=UPI001E2DF0D3|nr:GatB/YqeY domain-containing protein [Desemzia incerta]MCI3029510.1 GatB/YqeY domain-containing protein [Desemzia sp. C1]WHZ31738.1 GatB/YqeY domain-containing protein [Desemzia incerta]